MDGLHDRTSLFHKLILSLCFHQQHLVRAKRVWVTTSSLWCAPNQLASVRFQTSVGAIHLRCESEHTLVRYSSQKNTPLWLTRSAVRIMGIIVYYY